MKQEKWITGIICVLIIAGAGFFYLHTDGKTPKQETVFQTGDPPAASSQYSDSTGQPDAVVEYAVYICGAVQHPGVYRFLTETRVCDVIEAAGGFTADAAAASVNQARYITDGEQIEILTGKQWKKQRKQEQNTTAVEKPVSVQDSGKININTATETELMTLTGVGQSKAKAVVDYRTQNGSFQAIEEIMQVPGIKEGVFNQIKDSITV